MINFQHFRLNLRTKYHDQNLKKNIDRMNIAAFRKVCESEDFGLNSIKVIGGFRNFTINYSCGKRLKKLIDGKGVSSRRKDSEVLQKITNRKNKIPGKII